jgi:hypothetical protein
MLARCRLLFSEDQVIFSCQEMLCCEAWGGAEYVQDAPSIDVYSTASYASSQLHRYDLM